MGVYIKGMEMPTEQYGKMVITLYPNGHVAEYVVDMGRVWEAVPVPPHKRLIDADALKPYMLNEHYKYRLVYDAVEVANAPTIIEAEEGET